MAIKLHLTSANMGDADSVDFDLWARFVETRIDDAMGFDVASVDQYHYGYGDQDTVEGATEEQEAAILRWLKVEGWTAFCGDEWSRMRAEYEAKQDAREAARA